jgi:hypothetical protein
MERPNVDDRDVRIVQPLTQLGGRDDRNIVLRLHAPTLTDGIEKPSGARVTDPARAARECRAFSLLVV